MAQNIIIGSRGSELALWQANFIANELRKKGVEAEIQIIKTRGDKQQKEHFLEMQGQGFFTKEIEEALLNKQIDLAVHSYKDLPTTPTQGLIVGAVSYRENPSEMLLANKDALDIKKKLSLKGNAVVGTSATRRKVQLLAIRPDLEIKELRGNVPTRIQKLRDKMYDAIFVASAALKRLETDISEFYSEEIALHQLVPAPAQGVLALQIREHDKAMQTVLQKISHPEVEETVLLERKVFNLFQGGCNLPLGVHCIKTTDENDKALYKMYAAYSETDNAVPRYYYFETRQPESWPQKVADKIKLKKPASVFITRNIKEEDFFSRVLKANGYTVSGRAFIEFTTIPIGKFSTAADWIFFSSKHAVKYFFEQNPTTGKAKIGVISKSTADTVRLYGKRADFIGYSTDTRLTGKQFANVVNSGTVLFPQAKDSMRSVQRQFINKHQVIDLPVYETIHKPVDGVPDTDIILFTSPSNVEAFLETKHIKKEQKIIAMGDATAHTLKQAGIPSVYLVPFFDEVGLLQAIFSL